ncbi:hypothetical protein BDD43_0981 [Mucilaginibacter gracilis]|uniref:Uncharacterized protein n=1 Tax=Mucilaginibacter gracilis TaxID=423350 RepID=A0A495IVS5_9SPHI|nr:hypothetical protein BDD43_0981 [Mucilaginibacter gracilis]
MLDSIEFNLVWCKRIVKNIEVLDEQPSPKQKKSPAIKHTI